MGQVLFQIWILSFLFYRFNIIGTLSIDNMMVPILVLSWFFIGDRRNALVNRARFRVAAFTTLVFFLLIVIDVVKLESGGNTAQLFSAVIGHLKHYSYIIVPLLYISNEKNLKWALVSLLAITVINSVLASLGALGVVSNFITVNESTRIPGLLRTRGPIANYGDTALLTAFLSLMVWTAARHKIQLIGGRSAIKVVVLLFMFVGVVATQSRNVLLSLAMVFAVYYWLRNTTSSSGGGISAIKSLLGIFVFLSAVTFVGLNADMIISWATSMFGVQGEGTVRARLESYDYAIDLLKESPLFGLTANEMAKNSLFVSYLHNMWLGMALSSGVIGVVLVVVMIGVSLLGALRLLRNSGWREYGLVLASFIVAALLFSPSFYPGHGAFIFWFFLGLALTSKQTFYFQLREPMVERNSMPATEEQPLNGKRRKASILKYKVT